MLNGDALALCSGARCVVAEVPGESLWDHMNRGTLTKRMLQSALPNFAALISFER
jgi:hypothetical protein